MLGLGNIHEATKWNGRIEIRVLLMFEEEATRDILDYFWKLRVYMKKRGNL